MSPETELAFATGTDANRPVTLWLAFLGLLCIWLSIVEVAELEMHRSAFETETKTVPSRPHWFNRICSGEDDCWRDAITRGQGISQFAWQLENLLVLGIVFHTV